MMRHGLFQLLAVCLVSWLLAGCGGPPTIRESTVLVVGAEKITRLHFVYRKLEMKRTSSYRYGQGALVVDTGFDEFGQHLVGQAAKAFAMRQVAVLSAAVQGSKETLPVRSQAAGEGPAPVLVIAPLGGTTHANQHSTRTSYAFSAHLTDPQSRQLLWTATIDTSTWAGKDFVMKNIEKTVYDDAYAMQLMRLVVEKMGEAGLVR